MLPLHHGPVETELRAYEEPPAGVEPAPRPYKGRVLAVDTRRRGAGGRGRRRGTHQTKPTFWGPGGSTPADRAYRAASVPVGWAVPSPPCRSSQARVSSGVNGTNSMSDAHRPGQATAGWSRRRARSSSPARGGRRPWPSNPSTSSRRRERPWPVWSLASAASSSPVSSRIRTRLTSRSPPRRRAARSTVEHVLRGRLRRTSPGR